MPAPGGPYSIRWWPCGRGDFQGGAGGALARDVGEVGRAGVGVDGEAGADSGAGDDQSGEHGVGPALLVGFLLGYGFVGEDGDELAQAPYAEDGDAGDQGRFGGGLFGDDDLFVSGLGGGEDGGQDTAHGPHPAVESEFSDHHQVGELSGVDALGGAEDRAGNSEVEAAAALGDGGGAEADGEFLLGPVAAGIDDGCSDAVTAFAEALVGQADEGEGSDARFEVGLDFHDDALDAYERH